MQNFSKRNGATESANLAHGVLPREMILDGSRFTDWGLASALLEVFPKNATVLDLGCGLGLYARFFHRAGYHVIAIEGGEITGSEAFYPIFREDLTEPLSWPGVALAERNNSVLCLEVGEHIPAIYETVFLDNITRYARRLVLSWAIPGQGGFGHVNEQPNEVIKAAIQCRGFNFNDEVTSRLRGAVGDYCWYFRNTLMVFDAQEA